MSPLAPAHWYEDPVCWIAMVFLISVSALWLSRHWRGPGE